MGSPMRFRKKALVVCFAAAFASTSLLAQPGFGTAHPVRERIAAGTLSGDARLAPLQYNGGTTVPVTNCHDAGAGSLRDAVQNVAIDGDIVDMAGLTCSAITLTTGAIVAGQSDLTIVGPGTDMNGVTIQAGYASQIFVHLGTGTLALEYMTVLNGGKYGTGDSTASGGCIYSYGEVMLLGSGVKYCRADAQGSGDATGGGVSAKTGITVLASTIAGNAVHSTAASSKGGGVYTRGSVLVSDSWFHSNTAYADVSGTSAYGGAIWNTGAATILGSTISGNTAGVTAGADLLGVTSTELLVVANTTIADNYSYASSFGSGLFVGNPALIRSSTITGNEARNSSASRQGAGLHIGTFSSTRIESSIISSNTLIDGTDRQPDDVGVNGGGVLEGGGDNMIGYSSAGYPFGTIIANDPKLGPLNSGNGGPTPTQAPLSNSPAINNGNNVNDDPYDQRGPGYPRVVGSRADIGAIETDTIFANSFD